MKRTVAVITTSRADYSHLYWPLRQLNAHPEVDLKLIVLASHLSPEFGDTVREIEKDGFPIAARLECLLSSDTDVGMAKSIGVAVLSLADTLAAMRPDLILLIADRYEMLAPATVALALRIPIAHIEGGELSQGAIDDAVRNALTKMSHIHFTSTDGARDRVISMGEEPWRVQRAGAPSLDHLSKSKLMSQLEVESCLKIDLSRPTVVIAYHPVTLLSDTNAEAEEVFAAIEELSQQLIFCYPNADAGSRYLATRIRSLLERRQDAYFFTNLPSVTYWSLLQYAKLFLGNSSSGIMETASFALPTVNIGMRQQGRERPRNVIDASPVKESILAAVLKADSTEFRAYLKGMKNPYGDGCAAERIAQVLTNLPSRDVLLLKLVPQVQK
ncbi:UDP-N-acetylglucosamine 2-epimerase [Granulicella sp. S190]|uniref:UDP-N-acetylglucosamine 2-epimerase n=1 Tax=Granulicella sp. S190 TaxID=1747226 RepID=UPI00131CF121|nr:UDP-N-acetylglucosamine 2-epimerase [Granulicella sp. S190]